MFLRRFGGVPAVKIGRIFIAWFGLKSKWKLSLLAPKGVATRNGICDLIALNLGPLLLMREVPESTKAIRKR
jgi:hypothetical protein